MATFDTSTLSAWQPRALAVLRIVAGLCFLAHGVVKLFGFPEGAMPGQQDLFSFMGFAGALELVGGVLVILGLFFRPTAFILSGMMAVAYFIAHFVRGFYPVLNGGDAAILYCFIFLYFVTSGPGAWSLDGARRR